MSGHRNGRTPLRALLRDRPWIVLMWVVIVAYLIWALLGGPLP